MRENNTNFTYLRGIISSLNDNICRGTAVMENSQIKSFHYFLFNRIPFSRFPKLNDKIIATYQDGRLISIRIDHDD